MNQAKFSRGAWYVLALAVLLLAVNVGQIVYRFMLPTDGWYVTTTDVDNADWKFVTNLVGAPSELKPGDILQAVDEVSVRGTATIEWRIAPAAWRAGSTVTYTVLRENETVRVSVPVIRWTPEAVWRSQITFGVQGFSLLTSLFFLAIAWLTFLRRPEVLAARALLVFAIALFCPALSGILPDGVSVEFEPPVFGFTLFFSYAIYAILVGPSVLLFSMYFPKTKPTAMRYWLVRWLPAIITVLLFIPFLGFVFRVAFIPAAVLYFSALASLAVSIINIAHSSLTVQDPIGRAQMRWVGSGFGLGTIFFALNFPPSFHWFPPSLDIWFIALASLAIPVSGFSVAIAILRYRLFDIDIIIRRTLTYALVTALLAVIFLGSVILLQQIFSSISGQSQNELVTVLSTLAIAALFVPVRNRIQSEIDKRFNRKRYNSQQVLNDFANTVRDETNLESLTARLIEVVDETMQPRSVSVWLKKDQRGETLK